MLGKLFYKFITVLLEGFFNIHRNKYYCKENCCLNSSQYYWKEILYPSQQIVLQGKLFLKFLTILLEAVFYIHHNKYYCKENCSWNSSQYYWKEFLITITINIILAQGKVFLKFLTILSKAVFLYSYIYISSRNGLFKEVS